ncbi:MMPL family transporter [Catellatospora coxensis]
MAVPGRPARRRPDLLRAVRRRGAAGGAGLGLQHLRHRPRLEGGPGRPLREALAITLPQSAHAIRIAAFTLAVSFGLLAMVPLRPFRELAFALAVGILIDAFIVRSILAPALLTVLGSASEWPGRRLFGRSQRRRQPAETVPDDAPNSTEPGPDDAPTRTGPVPRDAPVAAAPTE